MEELCRWCDTNPKSRNHHCDDCYPIWRREYNTAKKFKARREARGEPLRYGVLFKLGMLFQGYNERVIYDD